MEELLGTKWMESHTDSGFQLGRMKDDGRFGDKVSDVGEGCYE